MVNKKARTFRFCRVALFGLTLILSTICSLSAEEITDSYQRASHQGELLIENGVVSADLREIPLGKILEQVREKANVWYECERTLLREKISIQFNEVSLKDGMKRILAHFDYALEFNDGGELVGLVLIGKSGSGRDITSNGDGSIMRVTSSNTLSDESDKTTNAINLTRPLPVKIIDRKGRIQPSLETQGDPDETDYAETEPEVKIHVISPRSISSYSELIVPLSTSRDDSIENTTPESGLSKRVPLDALE